MPYQYTFVEFVSSLSTNFNNVLEVLKIRYRYTVIQFVWCWSTGRKEIIDPNFKKFPEHKYLLFRFYVQKMNYNAHQIYLSKHKSTAMSPEL